MEEQHSCLFCNSTKFIDLHSLEKNYWVSGDRKIFNANGAHFSRKICSNCGVIQFYSDASYKTAVNSIFSIYGVMHNKVRGGGADAFLPKLELICKKLKENVDLPEKGSLLDIGCGGGEFLSRFHEVFPAWDLYGMDIGSHFADEVLPRAGVKGFFTSCQEVKESLKHFDLVTLNNMLSLANNPVELLSLTYECLTDNGRGYLQETDYTVQPWTMFELEAMSLVSKECMTAILRRNGFEVEKNVYEESNKELGYIFKKSGQTYSDPAFSWEKNKKIYNGKIQYMTEVMERVKEEVKQYPSIGVFGTSLAGTWLVQVIRDIGGKAKKIFFIDEDEELLRRPIEGFDVYRPEDVHEKTVVFLPFPAYVSRDIIQRMKRKHCLGNCKLVVL